MNTTYSDRIKNNTVISCWIIFGILILVHGFEAIVLRMDETVVGENFINKVFGILVMFAVLRILKWKGADIGFAGTRLFKGLGTGLLLALVSFVVSYAAEILILKSGGHDISFGVFTSGFSLTGEADIHTGAGFILMCVFFNIINVVITAILSQNCFAVFVKRQTVTNFHFFYVFLTVSGSIRTSHNNRDF